MVFEYESQWFGKGSVDQRLTNVADQLVLALFHSRPVGSGAKQRNSAEQYSFYRGGTDNSIREDQHGQSFSFVIA